MKPIVMILVLPLVLSGVACPVWSGQSQYEPPEAVVRAMQTMEPYGVKVVRYFPGPAGLTGIAAEVNNPQIKVPAGMDKKVIYYMDKDGRYLIAGAIVDLQKRENVTETAAATYHEARQVSKNTDGRQLANTAFIEQQPSSNGRWVYFFVDPSCPHSRDQVRAIQDAVSRGTMQGTGIRWVPISLSRPEATTAVAYLLGSHDQQTEFLRVFSQPLRDKAEWASKLKEGTDRQRLAMGTFALERNLDFALAMGISSTPTGIVVDGAQIQRVYRGYVEPKALAE